MTDVAGIARAIEAKVMENASSHQTSQSLMDEVNLILAENHVTVQDDQAIEDIIRYLEIDMPDAFNQLEIAAYGQGFGQSFADSTLQLGAYASDSQQSEGYEFSDIYAAANAAQTPAERLVATGLLNAFEGASGLNQIAHDMGARDGVVTIGDINTYFGGIAGDMSGEDRRDGTDFNDRLASGRIEMENVLVLVNGTEPLTSSVLERIRNGETVSSEEVASELRNSELVSTYSEDEVRALAFIQSKLVQQGRPFEWTWTNTLQQQGAFQGVNSELLEAYGSLLGTDVQTAQNKELDRQELVTEVAEPANQTDTLTSGLALNVASSLWRLPDLRDKLVNDENIITSASVHAVLADEDYTDLLSVQDQANLQALSRVVDGTPTRTLAMSDLESAADPNGESILPNYRTDVFAEVSSMARELSSYPELISNETDPPSISLTTLNNHPRLPFDLTLQTLKEHFNEISRDGETVTVADIQSFVTSVSSTASFSGFDTVPGSDATTDATASSAPTGYTPLTGNEYTWGSSVNGTTFGFGDAAMERARAVWAAQHSGANAAPFPTDATQIRALRLQAMGDILKYAFEAQKTDGKPGFAELDESAFDAAIDAYVAQGVENGWNGFNQMVGAEGAQVNIFSLLTGTTTIY